MLTTKVPKRGGELLPKKFDSSTHVVLCLALLWHFGRVLVTNFVWGGLEGYWKYGG